MVKKITVYPFNKMPCKHLKNKACQYDYGAISKWPVYVAKIRCKTDDPEMCYVVNCKTLLLFL